LKKRRNKHLLAGANRPPVAGALAAGALLKKLKAPPVLGAAAAVPKSPAAVVPAGKRLGAEAWPKPIGDEFAPAAEQAVAKVQL
jgi:hypothetical protein